jgi:hypothetical protein
MQPPISLRLNGSISTRGELPEWAPLGSRAHGEAARPHIRWAHARLEIVGVVLGQLQLPPPAANASAARIYPRSRSWSQGVGSQHGIS